MEIIKFLENLKFDISSDDNLKKVKAINDLNQYLKKKRFDELNSESVKVLVNFYVGILDVHYSLIETVLLGISIMMDFTNFSDSEAKIVVKSISILDLQSYKPNIRILALQILENLLAYHLEAVKSLGNEFIQNYVIIVDSETNPEAVHLVMNLNKVIGENLDIKLLAQEMFEVVGTYFPLQFKKSSEHKVSADELRTANKGALIASPYYGQYLFPLLLSNLNSNLDSSVLEALDVLIDSVDKMFMNDIICYYLSIMDTLYNLYTGSDAKLKPLVEQCLKKISFIFETKAEEKDITELSIALFDKLISVYMERNEESINYLLSFLKGTDKVWSMCVSRFLPKLIGNIQRSEFRDTSSLEALVQLLEVGSHYSEHKNLIDNAPMKNLMIQADLQYTEGISLKEINTTMSKLILIFKLSAYYSLFDVCVVNCTRHNNYEDDPQKVLDYKKSLISRVLILMEKSEDQQGDDKKLIVKTLEKMIVDSKDKESLINYLLKIKLDRGIISERNCEEDILFEVLSLTITSNLIPELFSIIKQEYMFTSSLECLLTICRRFINSVEVTDSICLLLEQLIDKLINNDENRIESIENSYVVLLGKIIASIGISSNKLNLLTNLKRIFTILEEPHENLLLWLCALIGQIPKDQLLVEVLENPIGLINILFGAGLITEQHKSMVYATYASVVNKCGNEVDMNRTVVEHLEFNKNNSEFIFWILRASMMCGNSELTTKCIDFATDTELVSQGQVSQNVKVLFSASAHICDEDVLFTKCHTFYEQQLFHVLAQKYRYLADLEEPSVSDAAMDVFLNLVSQFSNSLLQLCMEYILPSLLKWLPKLKESNGNISLQFSALNLVMHLSVQNCPQVLKVASDIVGLIIKVIDVFTLLTGSQRLFIIKAISWVMNNFPEHETVELSEKIKPLLRKMAKDSKSDIRRLSANLRLLAF